MSGILKSIIIFSILTIGSCQSIRTAGNRGKINRQIKNSEFLSKHFIGLALFDPQSREWLFEQNANKYFTPASNIKLFTLYAATKILKDSIPGIKYAIKGDTLMFWGTGDPTFLHEDFPDQKSYDFLKAHDGPLVWVPVDMKSKSYGPGWSWDDYSYDYQPERSTLPIYGNVLHVSNSLEEPIPMALSRSILPSEELGITRDYDNNLFRISTGDTQEAVIPFKVYPELIAAMLSDTLRRKVLIGQKLPEQKNILFSGPVDPIYSIMIKRSDNFLAEQILLMCSSLHTDSLNAENTIAYVRQTYLSDLPDQPVWVDGSGLSRYNLVTPRTLIRLLDKLLAEKGFDWLTQIFPIGGESGTLRNWYQANETPYVFAKTGTLSNNHNVSGYLKTASGKLLIFSFMNNNYVTTSNNIKTEIQSILEFIRDRY
ncbi:MAG: D-alanyl-D-alanine carboxypeptidase [Bacteroidetes bacterium]|nr:D-alanyl-D-alanine carboxypeptidase [Bacteroidota bacterium]MDA1119744.1 D-alanyl-D-alanine carboxypeptidase [Bacteroidota bacterium]